MFVTRSHHEAVQRQLMQLIAKHMEHNQALVQTIVDMKREHFAKAEPAPTVPTKSPEQKERDNTNEVISLTAGENRQAAAMIRAQVGAWRMEKRDEEWIRQQLLAPTAPDEDGVAV